MILLCRGVKNMNDKKCPRLEKKITWSKESKETESVQFLMDIIKKSEFSQRNRKIE